MQFPSIPDLLCQASGESLVAYIGPGAGITVLSTFFVLVSAFGLLLLSLLTWPIRVCVLLIRRRFRLSHPQIQRAVVVGLDGLDPARVRRLMSEGKLPHMQQLAESGTFTELGATLPPISPVAWSTFQTGVNPGKHNIYDFLNRNYKTYLPELSSTQITEHSRRGLRGWLTGGATIRMLRKSQPFWKILGEFGIFSTILRVPITFPPEKFFGLSLSAMCLPDLRGTQGSFTLYTSDPTESSHSTGGLCVPVTIAEDTIVTTLNGLPEAVDSNGRIGQLPLTIKINRRQQQAVLTVSGQDLHLPLHQATGWCRLKFRLSRWRTVSGICQFRLESLEPHFRLYVSPIHLDPERPAMPMSHPVYYSMYLAKLHDSFATLGLAEDTWGLNSGAMSEEAFLEQAWSIHAERERMFFDALRRMPRGLTMCVFDASDRIQHMFYRHDNPEHPANRGRDIHRFASTLDDMYVRMDELVGRVMADVRPETLLMVISDHGFCEFRRAVNLNVWLEQQGYLVRKGTGPDEYLADVDWAQTRAYAFGLSGIYLNEVGREGQGIVSPRDSAALRTEIAAKLETLVDPDYGQPAISKVYDSRQEYRGAYVSNGPDLIVGYARGYRASWDNAVGRCQGPLMQDNTRLWSGDHCVDPRLVPGMFLSNWKLRETAISIGDLAPTLLKLFGCPVPGYMDGVPRELHRNDRHPAAVDSSTVATGAAAGVAAAGAGQ